MELNKKIKIARVPYNRYFYVDEFLDPFTFFTLSNNGIFLIDKKIIDVATKIRELYGKPIKINTWWSYYETYCDKKTLQQIIDYVEKPNQFQCWRGVRTYRCYIGATQSAHKTVNGRQGGIGLALDLEGEQPELYNLVLKNVKELYELGLRRVEDVSLTPTWLHIDTWNNNVEKNSIRVVTKTSGKNIKI